jgi:hypothetical protein
MILATAETRNFTFQTLAADKPAANAQLRTAWRRHIKEYGGGDPQMMRVLIADGEVAYADIDAGVVLRDGEPI